MAVLLLSEKDLGQKPTAGEDAVLRELTLDKIPMSRNMEEVVDHARAIFYVTLTNFKVLKYPSDPRRVGVVFPISALMPWIRGGLAIQEGR